MPPVIAPTERIFGNIILVCFGVAVAYVILHNLNARRQRIAQYVVRFLLVFVVYYWLMWAMVWIGCRGWWIQYVALGIASPLFMLIQWKKPPKNTPKRNWTAAIEQHRRAGGIYDPNLHHVDHIFSRHKGGGHSVDNLRVITKEENLRKGTSDPDVVVWVKKDLTALRSFLSRFRKGGAGER